MNVFLPGKLKVFITTLLLLAGSHVFAGTRTSLASGNWSNPAMWAPAGIPSQGDVVIVSSGNTIVVDASSSCSQITVNSGSLLSFTPGVKLSIGSKLTVKGMVKMNGADIAFPNVNTS